MFADSINADIEQIANEFTKTESGSCFDQLSTHGWLLGVVITTVHPEPVEGGTPLGKATANRSSYRSYRP